MFTSRHAALIPFEYHRAFLAIFFSLTYKRFFIGFFVFFFFLFLVVFFIFRLLSFVFRFLLFVYV